MVCKIVAAGIEILRRIEPYIPVNTSTSIYSYFNKDCPSRSVNCNYERSRDDELMLIFTSKLGIISLKQHRGYIVNLRQQVYLLDPSSLERS